MASLGRANGNYPNISNTWLAAGYLSSSPPTPATQSFVREISGCVRTADIHLAQRQEIENKIRELKAKTNTELVKLDEQSVAAQPVRNLTALVEKYGRVFLPEDLLDALLLVQSPEPDAVLDNSF